MALLGSHAGSWFGLPDFGITEALAGNRRTSQGGSNLIGPQSAQTPSTSQVLPASTAFVGPQYSGPATSKTTGGGNAAAPTAPAGQQPIRDDIQNQLNSGNSIIDRDFDTALSILASQEGGIRRDAETATSQIQNQGQQARTALEDQRGTSLTGLSEQEQTAQKQAGSALQQARDLYRQMQQQNVAQLSATGLSSSSVAEALAERLGVETARRIAGVTGSRDEVIQNISKERARVENVFAQKKTELEQQIGLQIQEVQNSLLRGLDTINNARNQAATDKANARERLLQNAQSQVAQLQAQAQQFQQELQASAARRQASLNESLNLLIATPADFQRLTSNIQSIAPALQGTGLDFGINVNQQGQPTFQFSSPATKEEDDLEALLSGI